MTVPSVVIRTIAVSDSFREPDGAVGAGRDPGGITGDRRDRELGDVAPGSDAPDLIGPELREPQVAVGTGGDFLDEIIGRGQGEVCAGSWVVILPTPLPSSNHRAPSGPVAMLLVVEGNEISEKTPEVVIWPIAKTLPSVNQRRPSDPVAM